MERIKIKDVYCGACWDYVTSPPSATGHAESQQLVLSLNNNVQKRLWCVLRYFIFFLFKHLQKGVLSYRQFKTPNLLWNCAVLVKRRTHLGRGNFVVVVFIEVELIYNIALISVYSNIYIYSFIYIYKTIHIVLYIYIYIYLSAYICILFCILFLCGLF